MDKEEYIDQRVAAYSEAFDFYMDCGQMPDMVPNDDLLSGYMKSVIDANPQLDSQDATWKEVLKDDLLAFLSALLGAFFDVEQAHQKETDFIERYQNAQLEQQRQAWPAVYKHVKGSYAPTDVNIDGYVEQFKDHETQDVIDALTEDWRKAADKRLNKKEEQLLEQNKDRWERRMREWGRSDYERRKKIDQMYYRYPILQEIVRIIGREQPQRKDEKDDIVLKYMPILLSHSTTTTEIEQISIGNDLSHVIPSEIAKLSESSTEMMFFKKFAERQLQVFANKPPMTAQDKQVQEHQTKPRLEKGPIIVSVDTSSSMKGEPEKLARSLLMQLLRLAKKQHRKCFVITFSVRAMAVELTKPANWRCVKKFLEEGFSGGTNGEQMLSVALDALQTRDFCMADVLIISDFEFPLPIEKTCKRMETEHAKGTRYYGLQIGEMKNPYDKVLDKIWQLSV